jgi:hypothetical protein
MNEDSIIKRPQPSKLSKRLLEESTIEYNPADNWINRTEGKGVKLEGLEVIDTHEDFVDKLGKIVDSGQELGIDLEPFLTNILQISYDETDETLAVRLEECWQEEVSKLKEEYLPTVEVNKNLYKALDNLRSIWSDKLPNL